MRARAEARIWIYATSPRQQVVAFEAPDQIRRAFGDRAGIDRSEFDAYVGEAEVVAALCLTEVTEFDIPLCPRSEEPSLRPPQSCAFLRDAGPLAALESQCRSETRNRRDARREPGPCTASGAALEQELSAPDRSSRLRQRRSCCSSLRLHGPRRQRRMSAALVPRG